MKKIKPKPRYSEELKDKNKAYYCYNCLQRAVCWNGKKFICKRCGAEHTTVKEITNA